MTSVVTTSAGATGVLRLGKGSPLVLLNGYAATKADWDPRFLATLAAQHELLCLDPRGLGDSGPALTPFGVEELARDVADVVAELGLERAAVLGWSMGGYVAQALALARPDLVEALVLLSTDAGGASSLRCSPQTWARLTDVSGTPREQARRLLSLLFPPERLDEVDAAFGELVADARAALPPDTVRRQADALAAWARAGVAPRLRELAVPTLVGTGLRDEVIPAGNALLLAEAIRDASLLQVPGAGHALMAEQPERLAGMIIGFLRGER